MLSFLHRFSVSVWTGANDSNTLRVNAYFFSKKEKKIFVFKKFPDTCGRDLREYDEIRIHRCFNFLGGQILSYQSLCAVPVKAWGVVANPRKMNTG